MALSREQAALVAAGLVKLAVTGGGLKGPAATPANPGPVKTGAVKAASTGGKKVSTPKGAAFYHLPIGSLIVVHGKAASTTGHPGIPAHGPGSAVGAAPGSAKTLAKDAADKLTPHGWIPEAKWLEGQAEWEAIWKANEWKGHGSHHIWAGGHMFSVPADADVYAPHGTDPDSHHDVAEAKKIVVIGKPGEGRAAALSPDGTFTEMTLNDHLLDGLKQHGVLLPGSAPGNQHLPVQVGDAVHHIPEDWHVYQVGSVTNFLYAKDPQGLWHTINSSGVGQAWYGQMNDQMDLKVELGQATLYEHPLVHAEHQPPPAHPQQAGPIAGKTTIAGQDGPIEVSFDQVSEALDALTKAQNTQVKQPLKAIGNPLSAMDYHAINKQLLKEHPELKVAPGTKQAHVGQVKTSVLYYLAQVLKEQPKNDAQEAQADAAAEKAQAEVHHTYDTFSSVITLPKSGVPDAVADAAPPQAPEADLKPLAEKFMKEPPQAPEPDLQALVDKIKKLPAKEPSPIPDALDAGVVGGVPATQADIQGAIDALEAHPQSTAIKQILKGAGNPLQNADYWGVIHQFEKETGKKAKGKAREQFIAALKSYLGEAKAADNQSGTTVAQVLDQLVEKGTIGMLPGHGTYQQMIAKALVTAPMLSLNRIVQPSPGFPGQWEIASMALNHTGYYRVTSEHKVVWVGTGGESERSAAEVLGMVLEHFAAKDSGLYQTAKKALKDFHDQYAKDLKKELGTPPAKKEMPAPDPVTHLPAKPAKQEPTTPVMVGGTKVADVPFGSDVYKAAGSVISTTRWAHTPDGKWLMVTSKGTLISVEEDLTQQVVEGNLVLLDAAGNPVEPPKDEQVTKILNLAAAEGVNAAGPGWPLSAKLGQAITVAEEKGPGKELYVTPYQNFGGWQSASLAPADKSKKYFHVFPGGEVYMWTGSSEAEMNKPAIIEALTGMSPWNLGLPEKAPAPAPPKFPSMTAVPEPSAGPAADPLDPNSGDAPGLMNVIVGADLAKQGVPAGSVLYQQNSTSHYYAENYVYALAPDGTWYQVTKNNTTIAHEYEKLPEKLAKGKLTEIPAPTAQDVADVKKLDSYKKRLPRGAVPTDKIKTDSSAAIVAALVQQGVKSYYGQTEVNVYQVPDSPVWHVSQYGNIDKSKTWYTVDPTTFAVVNHQPGAADVTLTLPDVFQMIDEHLVDDAVVINAAVRHYGNYYKPKGKGSYLEIKAAQVTSHNGSGYNSVYKYGSKARASYVWHKTDGSSEKITPTAAAKHLETATDYHKPGEVVEYTPKVVKPKAASVYATVAAAGTAMHTVDGFGNADSNVTLHPDGSATVEDPNTNTAQQLLSLDPMLTQGSVIDGWHNSVVKPGIVPAKYYLFGAKLTPGELAGFKAAFEEHFHDAKALVKDLKGLTGFSGSAMTGWSQTKLGHGFDWEMQRDAVLALVKDLQEIPQADPSLAIAVSAVEPKFLKGLPPGITGPHDVFKFNAKGQAAPFEGELPDLSMLAYSTSGELGTAIKEISAQFGGGKIIGTHPASLAKDAKVDWLKAFAAGDMATIFAYDASGGKVSPAHPGAPDNPGTHQLTWAPWGAGQEPAGQIPEGTWTTEPGVTLPKAEVDNYLIKAGLQHAEYLTPAERRQWVKDHRLGNQKQVDALSRKAFHAFEAHDTPLSETPVWTDNIQPANAWDVFLEDKIAADHWPLSAMGQFLDAHAEAMAPFMDQIHDGWTGKLSDQPSYYQHQALQLYLDHVAAAELAEKMKPRYHTTGNGTVADQFGHEYFFQEGQDATKNAGISRVARLFGFKTPKTLSLTTEDGVTGQATEKVDGSPVGDVAALEPHQMEQLAAEHVLDWVLDNPFGDSASFIQSSSGAIVGTDKTGSFEWRLGKQPGAKQGYFNDALGHQHWGWHGGAGLLIQHTDNHGVTRYLLQQRSDMVMEGGSWSVPGGARDMVDGQVESPDVSALRETKEEWGDIPGVSILGIDTIHHGDEGQPGHWSYSTVHASVAEQFEPQGGEGVHGKESLGHKWVTLEEMAHLDLHSGFAETAKKLGAPVDLAAAEPPGRWKLTGLAPDLYVHRLDTKLYDAIAAGQVDQETADQIFASTIRTARRMAQMSDDRLAAALTDTFAGLAARPSISSVIARKGDLANAFSRMWKKIYDRAGWTLPEVPAERLGNGLHSGFSEPSMFDHVMAAKNAGVPAFFAGTELEDGHFLVWTELSGQNRLIQGESAVRGNTLHKAVAWAEAREKDAPAADLSKGSVKNAKEYYTTIIKTGKAVSKHAQDQMFEGPYTKGMLAEMAQLKITLETNLQIAENVIAAGPLSPDWAAFLKGGYSDSAVPNPKLPLLYQHMAKHYLTLIGKIEQAQANHGTFQPGDLPRWWVPKHLKVTEAKPDSKIKVEKRQAFRTLNKNQTTGTGAGDWGQDPVPGGFIHSKDGEIHLGDQTHEYPGKAWYITLPTGEVIELNNEEKTSTPLAQQGRIRFRAIASDGSSSLENIRAALQDMGLKLQEANPPDMELLYWRLLTHNLADRVDRTQGKLGQVWAHLRANGPEKTAGTGDSPEALHQLVVSITDAGLDPEDELKLWHDAWAKWTSAKQIADFSASGGFMPHLGHYDVKNADVTGGKPYWHRHDVDPAWLAGTKMLTHDLNYKYHNVEFGHHVVRSGMLASTEARLRALAVWRVGGSSEADMGHGSSGQVFLRQGLESGNVLVNPRVMARVHTWSFKQDHFGALKYKPTEAYFDLKKAAAGSYLQGGNETDVKDVISFLDDIELIKVSPGMRTKLIAELKKAGLTHIRGVPVEERIISEGSAHQGNLDKLFTGSIPAAVRTKARGWIKAAAGKFLAHPESHYVAPPAHKVSKAHSAVTTAAEQAALDLSKVASSHQVTAEHDLGAPAEKVNQVYYHQTGVDPGIKDPAVRGKLKGEVAKRVAAAMASTNDQIAKFGEAAGFHPQAGWGPDDRTRMVAAMVGAWATGSSSTPVMAFQNRARKLFGMTREPLPAGSGSGVGFAGLGSEAEAHKLEEGFSNVIDEFLKVMWEQTQQDLKDAGITHITLHRLMKFEEGKHPDWAAKLAGEIFDAPAARPFASWAHSVEAIFTDMVWGKGKPVLVKTTVPRELLLSYPRSGMGAYPQGEFVLLDSGGEWEIEELPKHG